MFLLSNYKITGVNIIRLNENAHYQIDFTLIQGRLDYRIQLKRNYNDLSLNPLVSQGRSSYDVIY